jgi:hypothetical protein
MVRPRKRILFFLGLLIGLLPGIVCGNQPTAPPTIAEYEISKETVWYRSLIVSQDNCCSCSDMVQARAPDLEPGVRVISTGREVDCRNKTDSQGWLIYAYLIEVEKLSEKGRPIWVPEDALDSP